jgi:hypothetical protein
MDATYRPLRAYIAKNADPRLSWHARVRDCVIEGIVASWPISCPPQQIEDVLTARLRVRLRKTHGGVGSAFVMSVAGTPCIRLAIEWWFSKEAHRVLMDGWAKKAQ